MSYFSIHISSANLLSNGHFLVRASCDISMHCMYFSLKDLTQVMSKSLFNKEWDSSCNLKCPELKCVTSTNISGLIVWNGFISHPMSSVSYIFIFLLNYALNWNIKLLLLLLVITRRAICITFWYAYAGTYLDNSLNRFILISWFCSLRSINKGRYISFWGFYIKCTLAC